MPKLVKAKVSNERKNLHRLAGEFLVASRLTQRGFMVTLQWGSTISYDILVFDKQGNVAFIEVKSSASYHRRWVLQSKYARPETDSIPLAKRFICCVDLSSMGREPDIYVFPAALVAKGLSYYFNGKYPNSLSYHLSLDFKPQGQTKNPHVKTVGEHIDADSYRENFKALGVTPLAT
ncbi:MAG: hypothetical protein AAB268_00565 [Elusimicrobiota bacterium]